jgi:hypothetical protein
MTNGKLSEVTDVSSLGNNHTLIFNNCVQITDVSSLGNVHTLDLWNCIKVTDKDINKYLSKVKKLTQKNSVRRKK